MKNLLIISAHADDNISCAGTIFKLQAERGFVAYEVVLTNSQLGQSYKTLAEVSPKLVAQVRSKELVKAQRFLGIKKSFVFNQPDLGLTCSQELMFEVVKVIREVQPEVLFLLNPYDAHPDHKQAFQIGIEATKVAAMGVLRETLGKSFRVPMVLCAEGMLPIKTQILVDTTKYFMKKEKLFKIYSSQASPKALGFERSLATIRGYHLRRSEGKFAEAFTLQEEFPVLFFENEKKNFS